MASTEHIKELSRSLDKAIDKIDTSKVLSILDSLSNVEKMSMHVLKATGLGKKVNKLKKMESFKSATNIQDLAIELVAKWKKQVSKEKGKKNGSNGGGNGKRLKLKNGSSSSSHKNISKSPENGAISTNSNGATPSALEISTDNDGGYEREEYDWETGDGRRDKMISKFISVLKPTPDRKEYIDYRQLAANIEQELGVKYGSNSQDYVQKYRDLHFNLKKNEDLKYEVLGGYLKVDKLITMTAEQLASKELQKKRESEKKWAMEEARNDHALNVSQAMTDEYKCGKCKQRKCKYSQAQTRAADEPMTTFITCLVCGNRWKM